MTLHRKTQTNDEILSDVLAVIEEYGADIPVLSLEVCLMAKIWHIM